MRSIYAVAILLAASAAGAVEQPVRVEGGLVSGVPGKDPSITAFKGIPFAAPPVGELRWRAPKQVLPWQGVRRADKFSASCIQNIFAERKPWTYEFMTHGDISEDCLYLNVWTAAKSSAEKRPNVTIWLIASILPRAPEAVELPPSYSRSADLGIGKIQPRGSRAALEETTLAWRVARVACRVAV